MRIDINKRKSLELRAKKGMYGILTKSMALMKTIDIGMQEIKEFEDYPMILAETEFLDIAKITKFSKEITEVINKYIDVEEEKWKWKPF